LRQAKTVGRGEHIDISMFGATLGFSLLQISELFGTHRDPKRLGSAHPRMHPTGPSAPKTANSCSLRAVNGYGERRAKSWGASI
jgi:crotonobetainyl-CoA:carnitine CoA-transferase CaiB-like acyl-CoA transferase